MVSRALRYVGLINRWMVCRMVGSCRVPAVELVDRYANAITLRQLEDYVSRDTHREIIVVLCQGLSAV